MERPVVQVVSRLASVTALLLMAAGAFVSRPHAESAHAVPPPAVDETTTGTTREVAVLAGGCFWGVQGVFQHVDGVSSAVAGYAGGAKDAAQYESVSSGTTGH